MSTLTARWANVVRAFGPITAAAVLAFALTTSAPAAGTAVSSPAVRTAAAIDFRNDMRRLWEDHVAWTRLLIVSFAASLPDLDSTTHRLLRNQVDIGDAIKPYYGRAAGDELTKRLTRHILLAAKILAAVKSGDTQAFDKAKSAWYANARRIARFLHAANPEQWPLSRLRSMMKTHLDLTLEEASDYLASEYAASVSDFDRVEAEILRMADMLSIGIIKQFPSTFRNA